jgi:hypothetical protein
MARANTSHAAELPPDHPDLTTARLTHAWTLWGLGRHDLAESTLLEVIASYRRTLPPAHPQILAARNLLVQILHAAGRNAEAADEAVEVLEARRRVLGADHPHTLLVATQLKAIRANAPPSPPA